MACELVWCYAQASDTSLVLAWSTEIRGANEAEMRLTQQTIIGVDVTVSLAFGVH